MKKALVLLICTSVVLTLLTSLTACGSGNNSEGGDTPNTTTQADNSGEVNTETQNIEETTETKLSPDLPDGLDFGGYKFRIFYSSVEEAGVWGLRDIYAEEENGEPINDAVYSRNKYLEDKYNFEIVGIPTTTSTMTSTSIKKVIQSGSDEYDALFVRQNQTAALITSGCLVDLQTVPYLDLDKPWWDKSLTDQLSIGDKKFATVGDIISTDSNALRVILFNKGMIADYALNDPYAMVRDNKWTLDNFYNMCKDVSKDENGDGIMDEKDRYGYLVQSGITTNMFYAAGQQTVKKDENNIPYLSIGDAKSTEVLEKINNILSSKDAVMYDSDYAHLNAEHPEYVLQEVFEAKRGLFFAEVLQLAERMRATDTEFGILPPPKADENQENYMSFADSHCMNLMIIPTTNTDLERTGQILEAMAAESRYTLLPAYYEKTLKGKYSRDDDSEEMLDIIIANKVISIDEMYSWGMHSALQDELKKRTGNFASVIEKNTAKAEKNISKTVTTIEDLG